ncbi:MAG: hypothetical protein KJ052_04185 [Candidatus Hydrogenedentes bacterium]|nr:hypothetical protein [Candidatus Hydrogenedentota bacterium]
MEVGVYGQEVSRFHTVDDGLPSNDTLSIAVTADGVCYAGTASGLAVLRDGAWQSDDAFAGEAVTAVAVTAKGDVLVAAKGAVYLRRGDGAFEQFGALPLEARGKNLFDLSATDSSPLIASENGLFAGPDADGELHELLESSKSVRQVAVGPATALAVAAADGLFLKLRGADWRRLTPEEGPNRWAVADVRAVAFDEDGRLWFASPQGVGRLGDEWTLFTGAEGLPYNDFTSMAAGAEGRVWFGTHLGAFYFDGEDFRYRQGKRWLPDDDVRDIAIDGNGNAWFATAGGVGTIDFVPMTLAQKAEYFESEIDKYHRRTPFGYVLSAHLTEPGNKESFENKDSDNDGLWTAMYGAGECYAYAATKDPKAKERATKAFRALAFLSEVTQGGSHPAPPGFIARTILPTDGPDPNEGRIERDLEKKATDDALWKIIDPRWPVSEDGKWYWKTDASSDELDGHYFFYGCYYDLVAETEEEKEAVRDVVRRITDHLIDHGYQLIDHDGKITRWSRFSPEDLNQSFDWWMERGLNSLSMLSYLETASYMTGDNKYEEAAKYLRDEHAYHANLSVPKITSGPGTGNQSDDEMAFMGLYNLLKYETDLDLRERYAVSFRGYWQNEAPEMNPLFNFMAAAVLTGEVYSYAFGEQDLSLLGDWLEDSVEMLKRYPLDRVQWAMKNSHRLDILPMPFSPWGRGRLGYRVNNKVLPIDERYVEHWNHSPWALDYGGNGGELGDPQSYLLPYYMGLYYGFIDEVAPTASVE